MGKYKWCIGNIILSYILILIFSISCTQKQESQREDKIGDVKQNEVSNMKITSPVFESNNLIPSEFTCDGSDISPPIVIRDAPKNAKSLALIMDDPDAPMGTFVHWVVWNIPPDTKEIKNGFEPTGVQGITDFRRLGYGGPCPPSGTHRYFFKIYALDTILDLKQGSSKKELEKVMDGHIIEKAELIGRYKRG